MRTRNGLLGVALLSLSLAACSSGGNDTDTTKDAAAATGQGKPASAGVQTTATVQIAQTELGPVLTDQAGHTLYAFTSDKDGASTCGDACIATWPALTSRKPVTPGTGTTANLFGKTQRGEGVTQAVYGDWPLYYYVGDSEPGDVNGQGVDGVWFVVKADGKLVRTS